MAKRKNGEGTYGEKSIRGIRYKYFRDADGRYTYARTAKELQEKIKNRATDQKQNQPKRIQIKDQMIFKDYCYEWLKYHMRKSSKKGKKKITAGTYDDYESIIRNRIENFKSYDIANKYPSALTDEILTDYFYALGDQYSLGSVDKTWTVIRQVLEYGMEKGDIPVFALKNIERPGEDDVAVKKKEIPIITMTDMELLYKEAYAKTSRGSKRYGNAAMAIVFIMYSGIRIGEQCGLKWKYVTADFESIRIKESRKDIIERDSETLEALTDEKGRKIHKKIQKKPKTQRGEREVPLPDRAIDVLKYFYNNYKHGPEDYVFVTDNGTPFDRTNLEKSLKRMLKHSKCLCKEYTPHALRHGYGSLLISKGADIKMVSELLGHTDVAFTYNVYIGILKDDTKKKVREIFNQPILEELAV